MKITDKKVMEILRYIDDTVLWDNIEFYPEDERDERTDAEFVAEEIEYVKEQFEDDTCTAWEELRDAKKLLSDIKSGLKNGKAIEQSDGGVILLNYQGISMYKVPWSEIDNSKDWIALYKRYKMALKRIQKMI